MIFNYDVVVVGGGHAGCEAAMAAANLGAKVLLISIDISKLAQMSCNPAIGGIAKGQIVREIDALGGYTGIITDLCTIQFRMLNRSKGPAMWSPRAQCDRMKFSALWRDYLENNSNVDLCQDFVTQLIIENNTVCGVITKFGLNIQAHSVILTNGTFLNGLLHIGSTQFTGGRISEPASTGIAEQLLNFGIEHGRMKTGTPPRIDGRSIDFSKMVEQDSENNSYGFSFLPDIKSNLKKRSCFITYTNNEVHDILKSGFKESPLFNGIIQGIGPRYCPSIETKLITFPDNPKHQLFIEPEGETTNEYYINGFSSSLPLKVQYEALRKVKGLENVKFLRPGYAIEYDFFQPTQLLPTLETKQVKNLYFAGQINGTTGYEEAACQGLMAGINAVLKIDNKELILKRDSSYIGVLIDDLVSKGVDEPYRMFTSRAEYRILLRQDNADERLTPISNEIGLCSNERFEYFNLKHKNKQKIVDFIKNYSISPNIVNDYLITINSSPLKQNIKLFNLIARPETKLLELLDLIPVFKENTDFNTNNNFSFWENIEIEIKYNGHIERERNIADKISRLEYINISENLDFNKLNSLSIEARQKLSRIKPKTIGQASRIPGVSPADINILLIYIGR